MNNGNFNNFRKYVKSQTKNKNKRKIGKIIQERRLGKNLKDKLEWQSGKKISKT